MSEFGYCPNDHQTPAQQFEAAAVQTAKDSVQRFAERLASEDAMKDTTNATDELAERMAQSFLLRKGLGVLTTRIEELEAEIDRMRAETMQAIPDLDRIAHTLKRFYFADLSMSSVQPIIALCLELNPDIVEQKR